MRSLEIPESLLKRAEQLAREDGVSLDTWVTAALAQKIGVVETAAEFFKRRSAGATGDLRQFLELIPDAQPDPGDEPPESWSRQ